jgi:Na+/H+ antiporter NhaD/arsenite permease-like protein
MPMSRLLLPLVLVLAALPGATHRAAAAEGLIGQLLERGELRCGVSADIPGFAAQDGTGAWRGLEVDYCRALAAAVLGDANAVRFVPLSASMRFPALKLERIDVLLASTSWTLSREALVGVRFAAALFHDGQSFLVPAASTVRQPRDLKDQQVCVEKDTTHSARLLAFAAREGTALRVRASASATEAAADFFAGRCAALSAESAQLAALRLRAGVAAADYRLLPRMISREVLSVAVLPGDPQWETVVRWVAYALLFGGMVVARMLSRTGVFALVGDYTLHATRGSGRRFLLLLLAIVAPVCALLPNATTVVLLAPVIIGVARALRVDFVAPMILTAIVSNAAGLLTLVGDPATFLVGSAIGMSFGKYLGMVSPAGLLAVLVIVPLLPLLMPTIWRARSELPPRTGATIERPGFAALALMVGLFIFGESLPVPIIAPEVAILGAALALLIVYQLRVEGVQEVLNSVDWKTLLFIGATFCLVQAFTETGVLQGMALGMHERFGSHFTVVALVLLAVIGFLSSVLANIPVVAASLVMTKGYLVAAQAVPEFALSPEFTGWPVATLPLFIAMMFGGTLGGNATLIGASSNIVSAGICASEGERVTFVRFLRLGLPITLIQLTASAVYVVYVLPLLS